MKKAIALDIGGTKIAAALVTEAGEWHHRIEVKSDVTNCETLFEQVVQLVNQVLSDSATSLNEITGIGVGVPGKVDRINGIAVFQNNIPWKDFPVVSRLKERFDVETIVIDNDVYMAAYAEWKMAQMSQEETFVYMTISTGVSCTTIHNGEFLRGAGFAGELGLIPVLPESNGSKNQRLEQVGSGPAIQRLAEKKLGLKEITTKEVFEQYSKGVEGYQAIIEEVADNLAQGIYAVTSLIDPQKIVFGGSVIVHNPFLLTSIKEKLNHYLIEEQKSFLERLFISQLAQDNGILGAGLSVFK
ncbi:ROK family protein [Carnobacterium sp. TMP28]|uniref:ROK family protein n=1 Tax=Carnobacterium sp. TMP28 TaxID=3397060 RepID=UPI0039DFF3CD